MNFALCNIQILSGPESCASLLSCDPLVITPAHLAETCQLAKLVCVGFAGWVCSLLHRQNWTNVLEWIVEQDSQDKMTDNSITFFFFHHIFLLCGKSRELFIMVGMRRWFLRNLIL